MTWKWSIKGHYKQQQCWTCHEALALHIQIAQCQNNSSAGESPLLTDREYVTVDRMYRGQIQSCSANYSGLHIRFAMPTGSGCYSKLTAFGALFFLIKKIVVLCNIFNSRVETMNYVWQMCNHWQKSIVLPDTDMFQLLLWEWWQRYRSFMCACAVTAS